MKEVSQIIIAFDKTICALVKNTLSNTISFTMKIWKLNGIVLHLVHWLWRNKVSIHTIQSSKVEKKEKIFNSLVKITKLFVVHYLYIVLKVFGRMAHNSQNK